MFQKLPGIIYDEGCYNRRGSRCRRRGEERREATKKNEIDDDDAEVVAQVCSSASVFDSTRSSVPVPNLARRATSRGEHQTVASSSTACTKKKTPSYSYEIILMIINNK